MWKVKMTIKVAANKLYKLFEGTSWFHTVGVADKCLHVYCQKKPPKLTKEWKKFEGYDVEFIYTGKIKAAPAYKGKNGKK
jgi:hypothetical protein